LVDNDENAGVLKVGNSVALLSLGGLHSAWGKGGDI